MALAHMHSVSDHPLAMDTEAAEPAHLRRAFRTDEFMGTTANMANGFTQGNVAILPSRYALDFARFCQRNPRPCPLVGISDTGNPHIQTLGADLDIRTDLPSYNVYREGQFEQATP